MNIQEYISKLPAGRAAAAARVPGWRAIAGLADDRCLGHDQLRRERALKHEVAPGIITTNQSARMIHSICRW